MSDITTTTGDAARETALALAEATGHDDVLLAEPGGRCCGCGHTLGELLEVGRGSVVGCAIARAALDGDGVLCDFAADGGGDPAADCPAVPVIAVQWPPTDARSLGLGWVCETHWRDHHAAILADAAEVRRVRPMDLDHAVAVLTAAARTADPTISPAIAVHMARNDGTTPESARAAGDRLRAAGRVALADALEAIDAATDDDLADVLRHR